MDLPKSPIEALGLPDPVAKNTRDLLNRISDGDTPLETVQGSDWAQNLAKGLCPPGELECIRNVSKEVSKGFLGR